MKSNNKVTRMVLLCSIILIVSTISLLAQEKDDETIKNISTFLNTNEELQNYSNKGFTSHFTGKLREIPDLLQSDLSRYFPEHKFYVAKMNVLIDFPSKEYELIMITNKKGKKLEGFIWGYYWTLRPSKSYSYLLKGHQAKSENEAIARVEAFAKLIAITNNSRIGRTKIKKGKVKVEFIRGENVFGILEVKVNKCFQFGRLTITKPNGKKLKYFV